MPPAPLMVRGLRGATTVDVDTVEQVTERSQELILRLMERNDLVEDDIVSALFTTTADVTSVFPATAVRGIGFGAVPLLCAAEIAVPGAMALCIRVLLHVHTTRTRDEIHHVYLHGAQGLRDDLPV
jgi:chorismate mutase